LAAIPDEPDVRAHDHDATSAWLNNSAAPRDDVFGDPLGLAFGRLEIIIPLHP